ncbi:MAG: glycosyltransferase [Arthrobacter sp.]|nr:glycosyltransferase [Arthrobacter sp.]
MSIGADHVLLTRFNLPSVGAESVVRAKEGWLRTRLELFRRFCLPAVLQQSHQEFKWIIYLDPESPEWLVKSMNELNSRGTFTPIYRAEVGRGQLLEDLQSVSGAKHRDVITTNLDNDDGLASDFVERLQAAEINGARAAIYLTHGLIRKGARLYLRRDRVNAFCSVRENWEDARTCWSDWHNLLGRSMNVRELAGAPAWLQVVHGSNVSNRIRGRRVAAAPYRNTFGSLLDGVDDVGRLDLVRDIVLEGPRRIALDSGRSVLKHAAMTVVGKEGLDKLKAEWAIRNARQPEASPMRATRDGRMNIP